MVSMDVTPTKDWVLKAMGKDSDRFRFVRGDISQLEDICIAIKDFAIDKLVNWAFLLPGVVEKNPRLGIKVNCMGMCNSFEAARRGASPVVGIDIAEGMISFCNRRALKFGLSERIKFIRGEFPLVPSPAVLSQKFNNAVVMGVMDYIKDPLPFLTSLREQLCGFALISFPGKEWLRWQVRRWRYKLLGRCTIWHYKEADVRKVMSQSGFRRFDITYLSHSGGCYFVKAEV